MDTPPGSTDKAQHLAPEVTVDDLALRQRLLQEDPAAWQQVIANTRIIGRRKFPHFDQDLVKDIAQKVVVDLLRDLRAGTVRTVRGYILRAMHNKCCDEWRKRRRESSLEENLGDDPDDRNEREVPSPVFPPEADGNETLEALRVLVTTMPEPCHALVHGRFYGALPYEALANKAAIPAAQVGVYLSRCLQRLLVRLKTERPRLLDELRELMDLFRDGQGPG